MTDEPDQLAILTLNIGSPSAKRAQRQLEWLEARSDDVLVLTETCGTAGTQLIADRLAGAGWAVHCQAIGDGERGALLASRVRIEEGGEPLMSYLPARAGMLTVADAQLDVLGVYVPSRDTSKAKLERKERFVREFADTLRRRRVAAETRPAVLVGDLNVVEPDHWPRYGMFRDWEYALYTGLTDDGWVDAYRLMRSGPIEHSWVGPDDDGFRFDHVFVSAQLREAVRGCAMLHETRDLGLSDHSALTLSLACGPLERLSVADSLSGDPLALF